MKFPYSSRFTAIGSRFQDGTVEPNGVGGPVHAD